MKFNAKTIARIAATQALYTYHLNYDQNSDIAVLLDKTICLYSDHSFLSELIDSHELPKSQGLLRMSKKHFKELVESTVENIESIDNILSEHLIQGWDISRISKGLLAIMRVGICEIKFFSETPRKVIVSEFTTIASEMIDEQEVSFVNKVLDSLN